MAINWLGVYRGWGANSRALVASLSGACSSCAQTIGSAHTEADVAELHEAAHKLAFNLCTVRSNDPRVEILSFRNESKLQPTQIVATQTVATATLTQPAR